MPVKVNAYNIRDIDTESRTISFDRPKWKRKITGTRLSAVLGCNDYSSEFRAACEMAGIYSEYESNKFTEAGTVIEPKLRQMLRDRSHEYLDGRMTEASDAIDVEQPIPKEICDYDHFHKDPLFGGMVDGYVDVNGKRTAILEIKTSYGWKPWGDVPGRISCIPESYLLQASLYAHLSDIRTIVFVIGVLQEADYDDPSSWVPNDSNTRVVVMDAMDMTEDLAKAKAWYERYILAGVTPPWSEDERDLRIVKAIEDGMR